MSITETRFAVAVLVLCWSVVTLGSFSQVNVGSSCSVLGQDDSITNPQRCVDINQAMGRLVSGVTLSLDQGTHLMTNSHLFYDVRNVSLVGTSESGVYLTCGDGAGLGFVNVTGLIIANVTIDGCGLDNESLIEAVGYLNGIMDLWSIIPSDISVGLLVAHCQDLTMSYTTVNRTRGLGMLAVNLMGSSSLLQVAFTHNIRPSCIAGPPYYPFDVTSEITQQIGGGAYILYHDYSNESDYVISTHNVLSVTDSYFANNADCSFSTVTHLNHKYLGDKVNRFTVGAAGGLSIIYAHSEYSVQATVDSTVFFRNDARYGAGAYVGTFVDFQYRNRVVFRDCAFEENGLASATSSANSGFEASVCRSGAGLAMFTDLLNPNGRQRMISNAQNVSISALNTTFVRNKAEIEGAGIFAYSMLNSPHQVNSFRLGNYFNVEWRLESCTFLHNWARLASAAAFVQRVFHSVDGIVVLYLDSISVSESGTGVIMSEDEDEISSAVAIKNVFTRFQGDSLFAQNYITALHILSSFVYMMEGARVTFERNTGKRGGALYVEGNAPALFVTKDVTLTFRENSAMVEGGAIYVADVSYTDVSFQPLSYFDCILNTPPLSNLDFLSSGSTFEFYGNTAPVGSVLFGTTLDFCSWSALLGGNLTLASFLSEISNTRFIFDRPAVGKDQVSTQGTRIEVRGPDEIIPGEEMPIQVDVFDDFGNKIYDVITSEIHNSDSSSLVGDSGFWYTQESNTTLRVFGQQNQTLEVSYFTFGDVVRTSREIDLLTCPAGFVYDNVTWACECADEVLEHSDEVRCDSLSITITTNSNNWVGTEPHLVNSTDIADIIIHDCHFDYCQANTTFRPPEYDAQCRAGSNRGGVLCGGCKPGYSVVFGTSDCSVCSNYYLFTILAFVVAGILVFLAIAFLEFTIDKGWLYALLFYCNIVTLYSYTAFPEEPKLHLLLLPDHFLSLELGFSLCFFDGMTALTRSFIRFLFPLYLHLLILFFGLLSKRFSLSCYFSPGKTFLTIMVLCYVSLLNTCIEVLAGHSIHTVKEVETVRWIIDANILYFRGWHAILGVIALVILFGYLGTFTLGILFPPLLYKYFKSGKPVYDALYAPFKQQYRCWIGIRLLVRALIISLAKFELPAISLPINLAILVTMLHIQMSIRPYKNKWLNFVDSYLISNSIILYVGTLAKLEVTSPDSHLYTILYACVFLAMAYVAIIFIFCYHIDSRFPVIRTKLMQCLRPQSAKNAEENVTESVRQATMHRNEMIRSTIRRDQITMSHFPTTADLVGDAELPSPVSLDRLEAAWDETNTNNRYRDSILDTM